MRYAINRDTREVWAFLSGSDRNAYTDQSLLLQRKLSVSRKEARAYLEEKSRFGWLGNCYKGSANREEDEHRKGWCLRRIKDFMAEGKLPYGASTEPVRL